jgi:hypothetical protein
MLQAIEKEAAYCDLQEPALPGALVQVLLSPARLASGGILTNHIGEQSKPSVIPTFVKLRVLRG